MSDSPYFDAVTSESILQSRYEIENGQTFNSLDLNAAHKWGRPELLACRVIRRKRQNQVLRILSRPIIQSEEAVLPEIDKFLDGPSDSQMSRSEHDVVRECGILGQVWAAMAVFRRREGSHGTDVADDSELDGDNMRERESKRVRRSTAQNEPAYFDSGAMQVGSSSPLAPDSQGTSSVGYVDRDAHRVPFLLEEDTLRLLSCLIRYILYFTPPQHLASVPSAVEFRDRRSRLSIYTPELERKLTAIDDGGLCLRVTSKNGSNLTRNYVAIIEAKREFQSIDNGRPVISDGCLAQMTCEALVARLADPHGELRDGSVIIICAIQHYISFLEFYISQEYLDDFESDTPTSSIHVDSTPPLDTFSKTGREHIVANLGEDHPATLTSMGNLALTYGRQGRWEEAEKLEVQVAGTLKTKLASTYWKQGRMEEAETLQVQVIQTRKTRLGEDYLDTLTSMNNLACIYGVQGRWEEAEKLQVQVVETCKTKLGEDHPDTLTIMISLTHMWQNIGKSSEANELMHECARLQDLSWEKRKLGDDFFFVKLL